MFEKIRERFIRTFFDEVEVAEATSRDPKQTAIKRVGYAIVPSSGGGNSRKNFETPDFDFTVIETAYDTEAYIRQAIDKYLDLIFKAGWELKGKNQKSLDYVKLRLAVMAESTDIPTDKLWLDIGDAVLKYANAFVIKARQKNTTVKIPGLNIQGLAGQAPIGGYFPLPTNSIKVARDPNGTVLQYQQKVAGQKKEFLIKPEDMVHIAWKQPIGKIYGVPFLVPVLDDIRLLREIEDNVSNLLYKYLHPLYKFIVGIQEDGKESTPEEIEYVRQMIQDMPMDGTLVIPERYDVEVVGAEGSAIDASWALKYFEQRVFTGLGIPETVFGRAATANKSTAENLTVEMHDRVKAIQKLLAREIHFRIIKELLMEGGFDALVKPEDDVEFVFNEIAIDEQMKINNQLIQEFTQNVRTFEETRLGMRLDPVVDESRLFLNMIKIPEIEATAEAKAKNSPPSTGTKSASNRARPANQHGKKLAASVEEDEPIIIESFDMLQTRQYHANLLSSFQMLRNDVISSFRTNRTDQIELYMTIVKEKMMAEAENCIKSSFVVGGTTCKLDCGVTRDPDIPSVTIQTLKFRAEQNINRILDSLRDFIKTAQSKEKMDDKLLFLSSSFEATEYRLDLMAKWHSRFAFNYGYALAALSYGREDLEAVGAGCETCIRSNSHTIHLSKGQGMMTILPPWHHGCDCYVKIKR